MNEIENEILNEQFQPGFVIDSPERADWALIRIAEEKKMLDTNIAILKEHIEVYQKRIDKMQMNFKNDTNFLESQLHFYFDGQPHQVTKTQEKVVLPSGTLLLKKASPKYIRDDKALVQWLQVNERWDDLKLSYTPRWEDVKVNTSIVGETVVDDDTGLVIEGVTVKPGEDNFQVIFEVKE